MSHTPTLKLGNRDSVDPILLVELVEMGFDAAKAESALGACNNNMQAALDWLTKSSYSADNHYPSTNAVAYKSEQHAVEAPKSAWEKGREEWLKKVSEKARLLFLDCLINF